MKKIWILLLLAVIFITKTCSFCPQYCSCNDTSLGVECHSLSNLRVVPIVLNPLIRKLVLSKNQIKDITLSLQFYQELKYLDISVNQLITLGKGNFESLGKLEFLNVSYNQVKALESGVFGGLTSLIGIDLGGNQIERVEREVFWGMGAIREIVLDKNRLEFIDWEMFRGLENLGRISLQFNFIQVIEPSPSAGGVPPWSLKSVQTLDVSSNQLTRVKDKSLSVFTSLKEINLCCNYIHTLEDKSFFGLNHTLQKINLSQNRLGRVPTTPLEPLSKSLLHLDLSSNRISATLPQTVFHSLTNLQDLRLNDNPMLISLHPHCLSEQINLINFEADYLTNLTEFTSTLLHNKPNLRRFSLKYSQISIIPPELLEDASDTSAMTLDLTGNPIQCNCSSQKLFQYLQKFPSDSSHDLINISHYQPYISQSTSGSSYPIKKKKVSSYLSSIRCQGPSSVSGILVKDLKSSDFSDCFQTQEDEFQLLCVIIGSVILTLILLVLGVKLCCFCGKRKFCFSFKESSGEKEVAKCDKLFEGFRRDLNPIQQNLGAQVNTSEKLFHSADNSSPSHLPSSFYLHNNITEEGFIIQSPQNNTQLRQYHYHPHPQKYQNPPPLPQSSYNYTFTPQKTYQNGYQNGYMEEEESSEESEEYIPPPTTKSRQKQKNNKNYTISRESALV